MKLGISPQTTHISNTIYKFEGSPRPPLGSVICWKDTYNSLKVVSFMIMVSYNVRIQIKISQGKKHKHGSRKFQQYRSQLSSPVELWPVLPFPAMIWQYTWCSTKQGPGVQRSYWGQPYKTGWLWLPTWWPQSPALPEVKLMPHVPSSHRNLIVRLYGVSQDLQVNKDTFILEFTYSQSRAKARPLFR